MKDTRDWRALNERLVATLKVFAPPLAISFHGPGETPTKDDVGAVLEVGWVDQAAVMSLPHVAEGPESVVYGPLADGRTPPDVVLLRINGLGLMTLKDAFPEMPIEGKPQCHIVAVAKDQNVVAASVGCALSRSRTGMRSEEMTCVLPGRRLPEVVETLEATVGRKLRLGGREAVWVSQ